MELIEQWLEDWWDVYVSEDRHLVKLDQSVNSLVEFLLFTGDDELTTLRDKPLISPVTGQPLASYEPVRVSQHLRSDKIIHHHDQVNAVMLAIKPGLCNVCLSRYTKQ